jgi:hypothetical protein
MLIHAARADNIFLAQLVSFTAVLSDQDLLSRSIIVSVVNENVSSLIPKYSSKFTNKFECNTTFKRQSVLYIVDIVVVYHLKDDMRSWPFSAMDIYKNQLHA